MRFFTSDQHIGHENILRLGDGRPFSNLRHMHEVIRGNWYKTVQPEDEVWVMGDIAMGSFEETIRFYEMLPGRKLLIPGNHDKIFSGTNTKTRIERFRPLYEAVGFEIQPENTSIQIAGQTVLLSHFPYRGDHTEHIRFEKNRPEDTGLPLVHGHTHAASRFSSHPREFSIGVDANDFTPVAETEIAAWLQTPRRLSMNAAELQERVNSMFGKPYEIPFGSTQLVPAPTSIHELGKGDILIAPTGTLWQVEYDIRPQETRRRITTSDSALRYIRDGDLEFWQLVIP